MTYASWAQERLARSDLFLVEASTRRQWSYQQFDGLARQAAEVLFATGARPGGRVALLLENSAEFVAFYFGGLMTGITIVPISPALHANDISFLLKSTAIHALICSPRTYELALRVKGDLSLLTLIPECENNLAAPPGAVRLQDVDPVSVRPFESVANDFVFSITFTSGTTARPKGVAHFANRLLANADAFNRLLGFDSSFRFLHTFPMAYMAGFLNTILGPFMAGGSIVLVRPYDATSVLTFWKPLVEYGVNGLWMAPTMLNSLLQMDRDASGSNYCKSQVRRICVGTAPLTKTTKDGFEAKYGVELYESYGLSELLLLTGHTPLLPSEPASVGHLVEGVEVRFRDDAGNLSEEGEIEIKTPYTLAGYVNNDTGQLDAPPEWFVTGDLGCLRGTSLSITGRKKDLIIRGGVNISPRPIEDLLVQHQDVVEAAVIGLPSSFYGEEPAAILVLSPGKDLKQIQSQLQDLCATSLAPTSIPSRWFQVEQLPRGISGKVQKKDLIKQFAVV